MKKHLVIYIDTNKFMRHDGDYFRSEAAQYEVFHTEQGDMVHSYPMSGNKKRKDRLWDANSIIVSAVRDHGSFDVFAYFGHGWQTGIQAGWQGEYGARLFAMNFLEIGAKTIIFYACKAALDVLLHKDDNFCEWIGRNLLSWRYYGWKIYGHRTAGDTTRNPYVVCYEDHQPKPQIITPDGINPSEHIMKKTEFRDKICKSMVDHWGEIFYAEPQNWNTWKGWLKKGTNRFQFPFMGIENSRKPVEILR